MVGHSIRQPLPAAEPQGSWQFWGKWVLANAVAELVGLGTSSLLWVLFFFGMEQALGTLLAALIVVIGSTLLEGSAVGVAQGQLLRQVLPKLTIRQWWIATMIGALIAWTLGMMPSTLISLATDATSATTDAAPPEMSDALMYSLAALMGLVLGPILALPQWWVLRNCVAKAWQWIPANAVAWAVGMPVIFVAMSFVPAGDLTVGTILLLITGLALAGAVVGAVHGFVLVRLLITAPDKTN